MIYRVWSDNNLPALCPSWGIANSVAQSDLKDNTFIEKDSELDHIILDLGGALWSNMSKINIKLGSNSSSFSFWAHQLSGVYDQIRWNWNLVEETGYVNFYGFSNRVCLSSIQAHTVWKVNNNLK